MERKKVLITGITGFIGAELAKKLVQEGYEVYGFVRHVVGRSLECLDEIRDKVNLVTCDITEYFSVKHSIQKINPDVVLHLAALSPVRLSFEHPLDYQRSILQGTINIAESIRELYGPDKVRLVVASTAEVYGIQKPEPFTEDLKLEPSSPYAVAKASMDMYVRMLIQVYNFNAVILRTSNTFGRKYDPSFFTEYLITQMLKGKEIYIGAPDSIRGYLYVDNHLEGYLLAMKTLEARGQVFNISGERGYTNREWTLKIAETINFPLEKIHFGEYPPGYPNRPLSSDQPYLVLDARKAVSVLGWKEITSVEEGLKKTVEYWKDQILENERKEISKQKVDKIRDILIN